MLKKMSGYFTLSLLLLFSNSSGYSAPQSARESQENVPTFVPGPDVIVGNVTTLQQLGSSGTQVGLAVGTDICNNGNIQVNWFRLPETDHPVVPQNLYRMSGGANNDERFEQVGQSWARHQFFPLQNNSCGFGCTPSPDSDHLGVGCSTADTAGINGGQPYLSSRAWVNPFTGIFPSTANNHTGHTHDGTTHRILVEGNDLNTTLNPGATYYAEAQLITPHEYAWCQSHPGECNMYNNASYRQFNVIGTTSFTFSAVGATVRMTPAIFAWPGATIQTIEPEPGVDGRAFIAYKVTCEGGLPIICHYEYAIYNQNLDRGIQSFSVPGGCGMGTPMNLEFHAPLNHPGIADDGTVGNAGYSNAPWTASGSSAAASWFTETFAQNPNANALRWGTLYNFRFDTGTPPIAANATIGFFKTGAPITVPVLGPSTECTPPPPPSPTPTPTPINISGTISYCSNPVPGPVPNVTLTLTGTTLGSTLSDGSGNYTFSALASGGSYTVTPSKAARLPGSANINTVDVIATQRHFLGLGTPLAGPCDVQCQCRLTAADVNGDTAINTVDVIAIQRFFLGLSTGVANTGKYKFTPVNRTYTGLVTNQTAQNYDTLVFGDTAATFVELVDGP
jgi:hypothetical protein